jgi:hypothetical protein
MSKKLIAVASAAALALTALVAAPSSAALGDITIDDSYGADINNAATTAATALEVDVPETNDLTDNSDYVINFEAEPAVSGGQVSASATGSVKLLTEAQFDDEDNTPTVTTGTQTLSVAAVTTNAVEIFAYNTSTTAGKVTITVGDSSRTYWIKGLAGTPNTITATFPTALNSSASSNIDVTVKDVFGNAITASNGTTEFSTLAGDDLDTDVLGAADTVGDDNYTWNTTRKVWVGKVIGVEGGGQASMTVTLDNDGFDGEDYDLAKASRIAFSTVNASDLSTQVTALTAQVAALKADYNALAAKWNKRVASKTAPKKKTALK